MLLWNKDEKSPDPSFNSSWFWIHMLLPIYISMWKSGRNSREHFATDCFFQGQRIPALGHLSAHIHDCSARACCSPVPPRKVPGATSLCPDSSARPWKILHCRTMSISSQTLLALARLQLFTKIAWSLSWKETVFLLANCTLIHLWEIRKWNV